MDACTTLEHPAMMCTKLQIECMYNTEASNHAMHEAANQTHLQKSAHMVLKASTMLCTELQGQCMHSIQATNADVLTWLMQLSQLL